MNRRFLSLVPVLLMSFPISAVAEVRLVTGGSDEIPHRSNSNVLDISADGNLVLFDSSVPVSGTSPGITQAGLYLRTLSEGKLELVSGTESFGPILATMSDDGRYLAWSRNLSGTGPHEGHHIFWRDRVTATTRQISLGATEDCYNPVISADGRYVAFLTADRSLVPDAGKLPVATNRGMILLYDSQGAGNGLSIVSLRADGSGLTTGVGPANAGAQYEYDFSRDGRYVAFSTDSAGVTTNTPGGGVYTVYRRSLLDGTVALVSKNSSGVAASGTFLSPRISRDGQRVAFTGTFVGYFAPQKMIDGMSASLGVEIYVKDMSGPVWRVTTPETGAVNGPAQDGFLSGRIAIDGNGDVVAFAGTAKNLVLENTDAPGTENTTNDIFRAALPPGGGASVVSLISKSPTLAGNVDYTSGPLLPGSGAYVAFNTHDVNEMLGVSDATFGSNHGFAVGTLPAEQTGTSYEKWAASLPMQDRDYSDQPAGDGISNLLKYFVGMSPLETNPTLLPAHGMRLGTELGVAGDPGRFLTLDVRVRRDLPPGFNWKVLCHENLLALPGSTTLGVQVGQSTADGDYDVYRFRFPSSVMVSPRGFMRLIVQGE